MKHPDYPRVSSKTDRHGKERWRFMSGKRQQLPGEPHTPEFDAAYQALIEGREIGQVEPVATATLLRFTGAQHKTLDACYALLRSDRQWEWATLEPKSQRIYSTTIERMLELPLDAQRYGALSPLTDLLRRHVKEILETFADTPHMERTALLCLRKLIMVALDKEWMTTDPTYGMKRVPDTDGHETWKQEHLDLYEKHWPIGSPQRVAYALALWLGNRASDVARLVWKMLITEKVMFEGEMRAIDGFRFQQFKGRKKKKAVTIFLPMTPMLERELAGLSRDGGPVVISGIAGRRYTDKRLSEQFSKWAQEAGVPKGYTMHGLRKALGVKLAHADATSRQIMLMLGHTSVAASEPYVREAEQVRMAVISTDKLERFEKAARKRPKLAVVK